MRQRRLIALTLAAASLAACGGPSRPLGAGPDVDVCRGIEAFDDLPEPDADDAEAVDRWILATLRVLDRVDPKERVTDISDEKLDPPAEVVEGYAVIEASMRSLRARVDDASERGPDAVRAAADSLANDEDFTTAYAIVRSFHDEVCE